MRKLTGNRSCNLSDKNEVLAGAVSDDVLKNAESKAAEETADKKSGDEEAVACSEKSFVEKSIIEATQLVDIRRPESIFELFDRAKVLNRGYDRLPCLTVSERIKVKSCREILLMLYFKGQRRF